MFKDTAVFKDHDHEAVLSLEELLSKKKKTFKQLWLFVDIADLMQLPQHPANAANLKNMLTEDLENFLGH